VVDDVMAQAAFPGQDAIGKHLWIGLGNDPVRVIGVVAHVRYWGPAGDDRAQVRAELYYPFAQVPDGLLRRWSELMSIAVRTTGDPLTLAEPLRRELRGVGNDQVLYELNTMEQLAAASLARQRFLLLVFGIFAGLAILLACIGIYGVLSYLTGRRVPEIGVRMALGASAGEVTRMVLRQSLGMILLGIGAGAAGAFAAARLLQRLVDGAQSSRPSTYAATAAALAFAALAASLGPALRASRVDPMKALRED
jgi:predicted lysophospholipase L1 biosynthesis ABC-type transport system permease subunit